MDKNKKSQTLEEAVQQLKDGKGTEYELIEDDKEDEEEDE